MTQSTAPDFQAFQKNFENGKTQLVWKWIPADLETPVSAYLKLCKHEPYGLLLESVEGGAVLGRYSIIGLKPDLIWRYSKDEITTRNTKTGEEHKDSRDPLSSLRAMIAANHIDELPDGLPPMAASGLFGYMGYDMVRLVEPKVPDTNPDDLDIPDSIMIRPTVLAIFDNAKSMICLVTPVYETAQNSDQNAKAIYDAASERLYQAEGALQDHLDHSLIAQNSTLPGEPDTQSNMSENDYHAIVEQAVEYIKQGEIFQVVLGQRFSMDFDLPSFELYRSLRRLNPSPFMFHLSFEGFSIVGSSPEIMVRVRDDTVTIRPIAGTRKRGATPAEDRELAEDLLADPKERAEHLMLLDLGRNDVGRIAEIGSVSVTEEFQIEHYSHVMHIVSNVEGKLDRKRFDSLDALFAGFPAGTVSGAPKVRAMEIIDELETTRRSYYGGCIGYISGNGDIDTCIALRTALVKDGKVHVQAGAGIVADSQKDSEYQETINKAQAIVRAARDVLQSARQQRNG